MNWPQALLLLLTLSVLIGTPVAVYVWRTAPLFRRPRYCTPAARPKF